MSANLQSTPGKMISLGTFNPCRTAAARHTAMRAVMGQNLGFGGSDAAEHRRDSADLSFLSRGVSSTPPRCPLCVFLAFRFQSPSLSAIFWPACANGSGNLPPHFSSPVFLAVFGTLGANVSAISPRNFSEPWAFGHFETLGANVSGIARLDFSEPCLFLPYSGLLARMSRNLGANVPGPLVRYVRGFGQPTFATSRFSGAARWPSFAVMRATCRLL